MNKIFHNKNIEIINKKEITDLELTKIYNIISINIKNIGIQVSSDDENIWKNNLKNNLLKSHFYLYIIYLNKNICGFIELTLSNNKLYLCELQLSENIKKSHIILQIINFILNQEEFSKNKELFYTVNNNNFMSKNTFLHLGGKLIEENKISSLYKIERNSAENYIYSLAKKFKKI